MLLKNYYPNFGKHINIIVESSVETGTFFQSFILSRMTFNDKSSLDLLKFNYFF